jgi:hypothetical protein
MSRFLQKLGWVRLPKNRSVLLCVPDIRACRGLPALVEALERELPRTSLFFIAGAQEAERWIAENIAHGEILSLPLNSAPTSLLFLLLARARLLVALSDPFWLPNRFMAKAYDIGIPVIVTRSRMSEAQSRPASRAGMARMIDWWEPADQEARLALAGLGVDAVRIAASLSDEHQPMAPESLGVLRRLAARRPPIRRPLQRLVLAAIDDPRLRRFVALRARRLDSLDAFRHALGAPGTIMCLGNGPSCEDPLLADHICDVLFRVNYRWRGRGKFTAADVVFTGQKRTLFSVHPPIFAFQTRRAEGQLVTHQIFNPLCRRMTYVTLERLGIVKGDWDAIRPTNGATMIAAAVALKPRKLVIGGIDLFEDPAGAYPGDSATPNTYVPVHDPQLEIRFILETLAEFKGELVIAGDVLKARWSEFRSRLAHGGK